MKEPEVSIKIALYYIRNGLTKEDVKVSIDGAHIKTGGNIHFDIEKFMSDNHCCKIDENVERWQGVYSVDGYNQRIVIHSRSGEGDVVIESIDGITLFIESKKFKMGKSNNEYPVMREAIGQLMTGCDFNKDCVPIVAVPYSPKSLELADRWSKLEQIKVVGIRFMLVYENGNIKLI
jgi:hypothetical protein